VINHDVIALSVRRRRPLDRLDAGRRRIIHVRVFVLAYDVSISKATNTQWRNAILSKVTGRRFPIDDLSSSSALSIVPAAP